MGGARSQPTPPIYEGGLVLAGNKWSRARGAVCQPRGISGLHKIWFSDFLSHLSFLPVLGLVPGLVPGILLLVLFLFLILFFCHILPHYVSLHDVMADYGRFFTSTFLLHLVLLFACDSYMNCHMCDHCFIICSSVVLDLQLIFILSFLFTCLELLKWLAVWLFHRLNV